MEPVAGTGDPTADLEPVTVPAAADESGGRSGAHAVRVAAGILLSRLAGLVREQLAARYFAVSAWGDVYSTAMRLPNLLQNLLGDQALSAAFIPFYSRMLAEGRREDARRFAGAILGLLMLVAGALVLLGTLAARPLVRVTAWGFRHDAGKVAAGLLPVDRFELTVQQVHVLFPMAGLLVVSAWALAVLNSHRRFFLPYVAPLLWNAAIIAVLLVAGGRLGGPHMAPAARSHLLYLAAWGALLGGLLQLLVQLPAVLRLLHGLHVSLATRAPGVRQALAAFWPVVAGRGATQISGYLDILLASLAAAGAASALRYALTLFLLPVSLFATSVAVTELPELSSLHHHEARLARLRSAWRQIAFLTVPTAVGFLAFGRLVVGVVFRGGAFGVADQGLVTAVLASFTVGMVPATSSRLLQNLFYSVHETRYPARLAVLRVAVSAAAGGALMWWLDRYGVPAWVAGGAPIRQLRLGAAGLGLGASVGAWLELVLLAHGARRHVGALALPWAAMTRLAALALGAALVAAGVWWQLADQQRYLLGGAVLGTFAAVYLGGAVALGFPELRAWIGRLR